ncbi:hypothetical protein [Massilia sp. 9096]|uniref:hypothetical protein n=1 Tax=Massilia sp. 9096 TaxID=1500894 RepID=UPI0005672734|nr:hypothetical protein [Massilia sp. 9096]
MNAYVPARLDGASLVHLWRRHPWWLASLGAHAVLVASLVTAGPVRVAVKRDDGVRVQVAQSLARTAQRQMGRELRAMEAIRDALAQSAGDVVGEGGDGAGKPQATDPAARAQALARQIDAVREKTRAMEMARLLNIPEAEARRRVRMEAARRPGATPPTHLQPEAQVAQLLQQAKDALAQRRAELLAQRHGVPLTPPVEGPHGAKGDKSGARTANTGGVGPGNGKTGGQGARNGRTGGGGVHDSASLGSTVDALATGLAMGPPGAITDSSIDMSSTSFSDTRRFGAYVKPPPVDAASVRGGRGRTIGAGGPYANRIFLDTWYVIGPFEGAGYDSQNTIYPPERGVDLDAVYFGKNDLPVRWTFQQDAHYPSVPLPRAENAVYYAWTEVTVDRDMDLWVWIGGDDDTKLWFNDRLVWLSGASLDKPWYRQAFHTLDGMDTLNLTEGQRKLHFKQGRNSILLKLYNGIDLMFYSVVLSR